VVRYSTHRRAARREHSAYRPAAGTRVTVSVLMSTLGHLPDALVAAAFFAPVLLLAAFYLIGARLLPGRDDRDSP